MTKELWETLSPEQQTEESQKMTQREWDKLFPPKIYASEPYDASGFTDKIGIVILI